MGPLEFFGWVLAVSASIVVLFVLSAVAAGVVEAIKRNQDS